MAGGAGQVELLPEAAVLFLELLDFLDGVIAEYLVTHLHAWACLPIRQSSMPVATRSLMAAGVSGLSRNSTSVR